ncbi:hypothetical protein [Sporolituus thermophilus]|uniref:Uncharacterized protein n=1 Tax=Sporolituus thermophilus DSM 23256 TaxID=1123285 RepID=A0A1G7MT70_9FIRM|nr:hypothetical protein [Sporolituus thermophilus]SDF64260.1 hypothetical protein SAMN05660235_02262 [Sporolituus thermophilus DSM 23256]
MNTKASLARKKKNNVASDNKNKIIRGNGWTIVRDSYDAVTIRIANPACFASSSYQNAVKMLANTKNVRIILTYVN